MKKLFIFLTMLVLGIVSSWADELKLTPSNGTYVTSSGNYVNSITFSTTPSITVTASANNMDKRQTGTYLLWHSGSSESSTYTLSVGGGYLIKSYTVTGEANSSTQTLTAGSVSHEFAVGTSSTFEVTDLSAASTSFVQTGVNASGLKITSISVTIEKAPATYIFQISDASGVIYTSDLMAGTVGQTITELPALLQRPYCTYNVTSTTIVSGENTVPVTVTYNPPFTVSSDFASATWYYATLRNRQLRADENQKDGSGRYMTNGTNEKTDVYKWAFVGNPYQLSIINKGAGSSKVLYAGGVPVMQAATPASDNKARWVVSSNSNGGFTVRSESGANLYINDAGNTGNLGYWDSSWGANDGGSNWVVTEVPIVDVTYNLKWNSNTIKTATVSRVTEGEKASDRVPWSVPAYCSFSYDVGTIESTTTEVNVTLNWNGPFEFSSSFNDATWYNLKINGDYLIYASTGNYNLVSNISSAESAGYNAFWGFIGNPVDGVQIINKSAGEGKSLAPFTPPSMAQGPFSWAVRQWGGNFSLDWSYNYLNNVDGVFKLYNSSTTSGDPTNFGCSVESASYRGVALAYVDEYANSHALGQYFGVSTASYNYIKNTITNASSVSESDYSNLELNISTYLSLLYPSTGYYRIKSKLTTDSYGYIGLNGEQLVGNISNTNDVSTIIHLTKSDDKYYFQTQGKYTSNVRKDNAVSLLADAPTEAFSLTPYGYGLGIIRTYADGDYSHYHVASTKSYKIVGWESAADASQWVFEDATDFNITMNGPVDGNYYATFCAPFSYTVSDGTKAYTLEQSGEWLIPTEIKGEVAAGTPVLLKGTSATATLTIGSGYAESPLTTTALTGTYLPKTIAGSTDYVLGKYEGKVGFYHWNSNNLAANRAYLARSSNARGFALMFDDDATGIVSTPGETEEGTVIYNLSGQRLNKMQKGINIVNGKKVLF